MTFRHKIFKFKQKQAGVALLTSLLLVGILISIVLTTSIIFIPKIRASGDVKKSAAAIYAAESAIEWCLYVARVGNTSLPVMGNNATYVNAATNAVPTVADCSTSPIKIIGTYQGISRSFVVSGF